MDKLVQKIRLILKNRGVVFAAMLVSVDL